MNSTPIKNCRLCNSSELFTFLDFGFVPLGNNLQNNHSLSKNVDTYPLKVNTCSICNHFQLSNSVPANLLYATNYTYLSGIGLSFKKHIKDYSLWIKEKCGLVKDDLVVDIGSNDGTTLKSFQNFGCLVQGVDPASLASEIANKNNIPTINAFFNKDVVKKIINNLGHADFITSQNVLAHVDDLNQTFRDIFELLKERGFFCFEIGYFGDVLENGYFDTIYHEHMDYHHASPLVQFLTKIGFDVIDLSLNEVQGGSLRVLTQKTFKGNITNNVIDFINKEKLSLLYKKQFLDNWQNLINKKMVDFYKQVISYKSMGKSIIAYGAPTKLVLFLKIAKLNSNDIDFIVDDNPHKVGKFIPNLGIEIRPVSDMDLYKEKTVIIIAWNFANDIIKKLKDNSAGPFDIIVPLPNLRVIKS
ncbi:class I SAM-dependent methyltransferase [Alphaproteobacteria bacterium]|nr:class I SAM-dependent methyltransferase [Alphaproteobacteria bacterium]